MKVSRGVATIGLQHYALSWVKVLGRTNACVHYYNFGRLSQAITKSWGSLHTICKTWYGQAACGDGHQNPHHAYAFCFTGHLLMDCEILLYYCF